MAGESTTSTISKAVEARFYPVPRAARGAHEARADVAWHRASVECLSAGAARDSRHAGRWALRGVVMMSGVFCRVGVQVLRHGQAATSQEMWSCLFVPSFPLGTSARRGGVAPVSVTRVEPDGLRQVCL